MKSNKIKSFAVILSLIVLLFLVTSIYFDSNKTTKTPSLETWNYELKGGPEDDFRLIQIYSSMGDKFEAFFPKSLVTQSLEGVILIEESFKELQRSYSLEKFSFPDQATELYFLLAFPTDAPVSNVIAFDLEQQTFRILKISQYYRTTGRRLRFLNEQPFIIVVSRDASKDGSGLNQKILLLDLFKDEARILVQLSGQETLNRNTSDDSSFVLRWVDDKTIEYGVHDYSKPAIPGALDRPLIEIRKISIE